MASKHLEEETKLKKTKESHSLGNALYECESCEGMFFFEAIPSHIEPPFCPLCGRRAKVT